MSEPKYCKHCLPAKRTEHFTTHVEYYLETFSGWVHEKLSHTLPVALPAHPVWKHLLTIFSFTGAARFTDTPDTTKLYNRSFIFWEEAQKRGIKIEALEFFGTIKHEFRFQHNGNTYHYDHIPLSHRQSPHRVDDKYYVKQLFKKHPVPQPESGTFSNAADAISFGARIGYPLVVKPQHGSLSCHATYPIHNHDQLGEAIAIAQKYQPGFVVEKYIDGNLYRASVLGKETVFVCEKQRPQIVGTGEATVRELIAKKNTHPHRKPAGVRQATLHTITEDAALEKQLAAQDLSLDSVPDAGEKIVLHPKYTLGAGCDIIERTESVHPENIALFKRVSEILGANVVGIDIICKDITKPYTKQQFGIIETNSRPYVDMHQFPSSGTPKDVAGTVWDITLEQIS